MTRRLVARLDNVGDVLLSGPAVRAVAASGQPVTFLAGPRGAAAAGMLPGVGDVLEFDAPWVPFEPGTLSRSAIDDLVHQIGAAAIDEALILTSFHQSPLPLALLLRMAGVARIAATSVDYPGALLDVRQSFEPALHEVEQGLALCRAAGFELPASDDGALRVELPAGPTPTAPEPFVLIHPGASVPSRRLPDEDTAALIAALTNDGIDVVVTGTAAERPRAQHLAATGVQARTHVVAGKTDLASYMRLTSAATAVVCGNTAAAHVAAAVGTPVVVAFAPVVPVHRWRPWRVPHVVLGSHEIGCAGCRSRECPIPGQPCLRPFTVTAVRGALEALTGLVPLRAAIEVPA